MTYRERVCPRCHRVCFSLDEYHDHECFDMGARIDRAIADAKRPGGGYWLKPRTVSLSFWGQLRQVTRRARDFFRL
jgi:hypothetical protein